MFLSIIVIPLTNGSHALQLSRAKVGFGELYRDAKRHAEYVDQAGLLLDRAIDRIESLERVANSQTHGINDLRGQVSELRGEPVHSSDSLSPSLRSEEEVADNEAEAEEDAKVRALVEAPAFQEVEGPEFTLPLEENENPLPIAGTSTIPRLGVGYQRNAEQRVWILGVIRARQEAARRDYETRESDAQRRRMAMEAFEDPALDFDPRVDS
jgi:hypothetical protein